MLVGPLDGGRVIEVEGDAAAHRTTDDGKASIHTQLGQVLLQPSRRDP
jgi:hypothetical protein